MASLTDSMTDYIHSLSKRSAAIVDAIQLETDGLESVLKKNERFVLILDSEGPRRLNVVMEQVDRGEDEPDVRHICLAGANSLGAVEAVIRSGQAYYAGANISYSGYSHWRYWRRRIRTEWTFVSALSVARKVLPHDQFVSVVLAVFANLEGIVRLGHRVYLYLDVSDLAVCTLKEIIDEEFESLVSCTSEVE